MKTVKKNSLGKRIFAFVLAVIMLFTTMPVGVNVAKAENESDTDVTYTFHVVENADSGSETPIEGAVVTIFSTADDEYGLTLEKLENITEENESVLKQIKTDKDGIAKVTLSLDEISESPTYTVTYTKIETVIDEDETESTETVDSTEAVDSTEGVEATEENASTEIPETKTTVYSIARGSLTDAGITEEIVLKQATGIRGTICIGDENTKPSASFNVKLQKKAGENQTVEAETKSYADGTFVFDNVTYEENATYTILVDTESYEEDSCQKTVSGFDGTQGVVVEQGNLILKEKIVPTSGSVDGKITDSDTTDFISGAAIYLLNGEVEKENVKNAILEEGVSSVLTTDGTYQFSDVAFGTYTIAVIHSDYKIYTKTVILDEDNSPLTEDICLNKKEELILDASFTKSEVELLINEGFDVSEINALIVTKANKEELTEEEKSKITVSYRSSDVNIIEIKAETGAFEKMNTVGTATITAMISSDEYKIKTVNDSETEDDVIKTTYEVKVWEFAFDTEELNTSELVSKIYGDSSFSTKAILKGDNSQKEIDIADVEYSLNPSDESIANIVYTDADGMLVEDKKNASDVKIAIVGANDETVEVLASYCGVTISYRVKVNKAGSLSGFAWQGYDSYDIDGNGKIVVNYVYGESPKEIVVSEIDGVTVKYESSNPEIVSVDETTGEVTIHSVTTDTPVTITANITDTDNYDITPITYTIRVRKGDIQNFDWNKTDLDELKEDTFYTITSDETTGKLSKIEVSYQKDKRFTLGASGSDDAHVTYVYASSDLNVAKVNETTGEIEAVGVGTTTITCTVTSTFYEEKDISYVLTVDAGKQPLKWNKTDVSDLNKFAQITENGTTTDVLPETGGVVSIVYDETKTEYTLGVLGQNTDLTYQYMVTGNENGVITLDETSGKVTIHKAGEVKITYKAVGDNPNYEVKELSYTLQIDKAKQGNVTLKDGDGTKNLAYSAGLTYTNAIHAPADNAVVTYTSDDTSIATVDANGTVHILNIGTITITVSVSETERYLPKTMSYTLKVAKGEVPNLNWKQENITQLGEEYTVTTDEITGKLSNIKVSYQKGRRFILGAASDDDTNVSYVYTSSHSNVAQIDETTGEIEIFCAGSTTITCTVTSSLYEEKTISYELEVKEGNQHIVWKPINWKNPTDLGIEIKGETLTVEYQKGLVYDSLVEGQITDDDLSYAFSLEKIDGYENVAEIDGDSGEVTINNAGKVKICYTSKDKDDVKKYMPLTISYDLIVELGKQPLKWNKTDVSDLSKFAQITENGTLTDILPETGGVVSIVYEETKTEYTLGVLGQNKDLTYQYTVTGNEDGVITLDETSGKITIHKAGEVKITYKAVGNNPNYEAKELSYTLRITENPQSSLKWNRQNIPEKLNVTQLSDMQGAVSLTYDPNFTTFKIGVTGQITGNNVTYGFVATETDVAKIESDGTVIIKQAGTIRVTYVSQDISSGHYERKELTYDLTIHKAQQSGVDWTQGSGEKNLIYTAGLTYTNAIHAPVDNAVVTYTSGNTSIATVDENGTVHILNTGTVTITVSVAETKRYSSKTLSYKLVIETGKQPLEWKETDVSNLNKIAQIKQADGTLTNTLPKAGGVVSIVYDETKTEYILGALGQNKDLTYEYTVTGNENGVITLDKISGKVTIHKAGTVKITYKAVGNNPNYEAKELSYTLQITENPQSSLKWNRQNVPQKLNATQLSDTQGSVSLTYDPNFTTFKIGVTGQITGNNVTYGFVATETDVAKIESDGTVTIKQAGTIRVTYVSQDINDGHYKRKVLTYDLTIYKAQQSGIDWTQGSDDKELVYDADLEYINPIKTPADNATVTYTSSDTTVAMVDATGKVSILKAGEVTITVSVGETVRYLPKTLQYKIRIEKGVQKISFTSSKYSFTNGGSFASPVADSDKYQANGTYTYTIVEDANGVLSYIHPNTGELSFTLQTGTVTIKVVREEDERYKGAETSYELTVKEWNPLANNNNVYYSIDGEKEDVSSVWYTKSDANHPIQLVAAEGYQLYKGLTDPVPDTVWSQSIRVTETHDGTDNGIVYYIRNKKTGYVSKQYTLDNIHIDTTVPNAAIEVDTATTWERILSFFTFHLLGQDTPELKIKSGDTTSGVKQVLYYISSSTKPLEVNGLIDTNALEEEANWKNYTGTVELLDESVAENVIYTKVIDNAGNSTYASTNGLIFDGTKPVVTPSIVTEDSNGIYNGNVEINLNVTDPTPYSGIMQISYVVENGDTVTDRGTLFTFEPKEEGNPSQEELVSNWNTGDFGKNVIVKAVDNNSDNVKVSFIVTDNAGNTTESVVNLKIDITNPVIDVRYDNNGGDTTFADSVYYNADRMAVITIKERHFDPNKVKLVIQNTDGVIPTLSGWTKLSDGTGNGDDATYQASVVFSADGDYTFDISCEDDASNKNVSVNYGDSQAPMAFTIDKTVPTISVSYDNNDVSNENYYKADRVATITIFEHNFDASRVNTIISATDDGQTVSSPVISGWSSSGDTHTATISYASDALYTFDIEYTDKAGNEMADFTPETFYVDKTMPSVSITEITDLSANNGEKIGFVITATDTNFDVFEPVVTAVIQTEEGFTTTQIDVGSISEITNGQVYTVDNLEKDGIYSITCTVTDKAGNAYTEVNLQHADGSTYVENRAGEDTLLMFSVNRNGSVFDISNNTREILEQYYIQSVEEDVVIHEVNTDELAAYTLSLNGEELTEGVEYSVSNTGGGTEWMRYTYTVNRSLFEEEGEYVLVVSSTDSAENNAFSDVKNANISFVVDRTAPIVTVTGMESNRSYQTDKQTVTLIPTDDGGILETLMIRLVDRNGNVLKEILNMSGDGLRDTLEENGGIVTFELEEGLRQNVQIICGDGAYASDGTANTFDEIFENVSVSQSAVAIFFAGDMIVYIAGGTGAAAVTGGGIFLFRKRKFPKFKKKVK